MRIGIYWEQDSWGGVDTQLLTLLRNWPESNDEFVLFYNRGNLGLERIRTELLALSNVRLQEIVSLSYNEVVRRMAGIPLGRWLRLPLYALQPLLLLFMAHRLACAFRKCGHLDVMLADNGGYPAAWGAQSAIIAAARAAIKCRVLLVHHSSTPPRMFMSWYERLVDGAVGRCASAIVCVSYATRRSLLGVRAFSEAASRIRVIHNGIARAPADAGSSKLFDLRGAAKAGTELLVGIVGRVQPYKGHEDIVFALSRLESNVRQKLMLLIIGGGEPGELARLQRLTDHLNVSDQVRFLGYVPGDPAELIAQLDLLVIATRSFEGFGLTLAEAMLAGTPILTTRVGAIPEFVNEANGVLINPGSPQEISAALRNFVAAPEDWRLRALNAQQNTMHGAKQMSLEYRRLFQECIAEHPA